MAKHKKTVTTKVAESAYFHTGNSGVTISMKEIATKHSDHDDKHAYRLEVRHGAHGAHSSFDVPLGSLHMVEWMIEGLVRLRERMKSVEFSAEYAFQYAKRDEADDYVTVKFGLRREEVWRETVASQWGTISQVVAYNWFDGDRLMRTEPVSVARSMASGCAGSESSAALYRVEDIGKEVVNGKVVD